MNNFELKQLIREVIKETLDVSDCAEGVLVRRLPEIKLSDCDKFDTGNESDQVLLKDVLTTDCSPNLGCGIMEMKNTTFNWHLDYDEIDYVIEGTLEIIKNGKKVTVHKGEIVYIPKGSSIKFSVTDTARFMYVTYPANWN